MDKRALSALPRPTLTEKDKEMLSLVPNMAYLATANRQEVNGIDTLAINFFQAEERKLKPAFRTFFQMEDYITQDLTMEKTRWKTGAISHLMGHGHWNRDGGNIVFASTKEKETILGFLCGFKETHDVKAHGGRSGMELLCRIDECQDKIKERKLKEKHDKEKERIDSWMAKFGGVPDDYDRFVREKAFEREQYMFYNGANKSAHCTSCGMDFELDEKRHLRHKTLPIRNDRDEVRHNHVVSCPHCGGSFQCKSEGMGRNGLFAIQWSVLVQKHGEDVLVRYFCHTKDFRGDCRDPKIVTMEKFRTIHTKEESMDFEWCRFKRTHDLRWCHYKEKGYGCFSPPETSVPRSAVLYNDDLLETVSGTCMKYSAIDIYMDKVAHGARKLNVPWAVDWYFNQYRRTPYLEQLLKIGFYQIVEHVMKKGSCPEFMNGRTVLETLGVNKVQFNMLRAIGDPTAREVMMLRYAGTISQKEFDMLRHMRDGLGCRTYEKYLDMRPYTTIHKVKKYVDNNCARNEGDYFDYVRWTREMGYDMRNEFNLYPKDFKKAHDERAKEYVEFQDKRTKEAAKRFNGLLKKLHEETKDVEPMNLRIGGLFVRLPEQLDELKKEGEALHHCVGTYRDKVAKGETMIFFIRKEKEPDEPYYTLEWKGKVIQCRGSHNCDMTPEVKAFVELFQKKMMDYGRAPRKLRKAG